VAKPALARSTSTTPALQGGLDVIIARGSVRVGSEEIDPSNKKNGPNDLYIVPLAEAAKKRGLHEARVAVAPDVGYRTLVDVLYTLGQVEIGQFHLLVDGPRGTSSIELSLPKTFDAKSKLHLTLLVVSSGIGMKASDENVAPGCDNHGPGITFPKKDGAHDLAGLASCATLLKGLSPAFADEDTVTLAANPDVDFQTLVAIIDAVRPSFPKVAFALAK
jgi:hypothetical protein